MVGTATVLRAQSFSSVHAAKSLKIETSKERPNSLKNIIAGTKEMASLIRKLISTSNAAKPVAPYNQAVVADRTVYVSGCLGLDKNTMKLVPGGVAEQAAMALRNMEAVLVAADSGIDRVVKNTIFLKDLNDFGAVNEVYKSVFCQDFPARSCVQVARLPMDALVEIECIAMTGPVVTVKAD